MSLIFERTKSFHVQLIARTSIQAVTNKTELRSECISTKLLDNEMHKSVESHS